MLEKDVTSNNTKGFKKPVKRLNSNKFKVAATPDQKGLMNSDKQNPEKVDWTKLKNEKKTLKVQRKTSKPLYAVSLDAKKIYEKLKCKSAENKEELAQRLYTVIKKAGCIQKFVMAHDNARIIQCLLKNASGTIRNEILEDLLPIVVPMCTSKYSSHCVLKMIKYSNSKMKHKIIENMFGNIIKLVTNSVSHNIIDVLFLTWASAKQRAFMKQEFYGDIYKKLKDEEVKELSDTYKNSSHLKNAILGSVKANLEHAANKKFVDNSLIHAVLLEFLKECSENDRTEIIALYSPLIPSIVTTKEGCKAAILCFYHSVTRDRRAIVKSLKENLEKISLHEQGHILVLAIVNTMDDTKAIKKFIFDKIFSIIETIMKNQWGRKIIEWFVSPADKEFFHPKFISFLEEGLSFGKKDKLVRRQEIFEQIEEDLCNSLTEKPAFWLQNGNIGLVTAAIIKNVVSKERLEKVAYSLAKIICQPDWIVELNEEELNKKTKKVKKLENVSDEKLPKNTISGIEDPGLHMILKKIIKQDNDRIKSDKPSFGRILLEELDANMVKEWIQLNKPCFIFLTILENGTNETQTYLKNILMKQEPLLKKQQHVGAKILLTKLIS